MHCIQKEYITSLSNNININCFDIGKYINMTSDDYVFIKLVLDNKHVSKNIDKYIKLSTILDIFLYIFKGFIECLDDTHYHLFSIILINILLDDLIELFNDNDFKDEHISKIYTILKDMDFINYTNCYDDRKIDTSFMIKHKMKSLSLIVNEIMF
jgi:hypothetical protein